MKKISHLLLLSIFLASCANAVITVPNVTVTSEVTVTFTPAPTEIPTTPTETPDPNAPEGWTRHENKKYYLDKTENGKTNTFVWTVKTDVLTGEVVYKGFARLITPDGIPVIDNPFHDFNVGTINVYLSDTVLDAVHSTFKHTENTPEIMGSKDLSSVAIVSLWDRNNDTRITGDEAVKLSFSMKDGKYPIEYFTDDPTLMYTWAISRDHGTEVFVTDWDSLVRASEFTIPGKGNVKLRAKILGMDKDGNVLGVIAANVPLDTLSDEQWWMVILLHTANVVDRPDQSALSFSSTLGDWIAFADNANKISEP